ncbi:MAG: T9SS type A sorting domain-containing protein, partial [Bacteroidales bacterium]|nr:T9SS type A sorting domain-containing protein [Bacteroidales bacterium]
LTVTADDKEKTYGEENPEFTLSYTGFVNDDTSDDIDELPVVTSEATVNSIVGQYQIEVSGGGDNNYEFNFVNGVLVVKPISGVQTADKYAIKCYPNPTVNYLYIDSEILTDDYIKIYNSAGSLVIKELLIDKTIDVASLKPGLYLLNINCVYVKFVKE